MRIRAVGMLALWLVTSVMGAQAVEVQYQLSNGWVSGVSDAPIENIDGYGVVTMSGTSSQILWPVPSGCPAGKPDWSMVTNPDTVALDGTGFGIRSGLLFFHTTSTLLTGCHLISSLSVLNALYRRVMIETIASFEFLGALNEVSVGVREACPGTTGGANCDTARANLTMLNADRPGTAGTANFTTQLVTLRTDKCSFQLAQGWGPCP
jgi:hypothetical protein